MLGLGFVRPPTRAELKVIFFVAAIACIALGCIGIVAGVRAPPDKLLLAHQAIFYGAAALFFGVIFFIFVWLLCRFEDRS